MTRPITLGLAYYENPGMLTVQLAALAALPSVLRRAVTLVVVDDGSPDPAAFGPLPAGLDARLYRMKENHPWNQDACRNLAALVAPSEWLLLTDMDHVPSEALWVRIMHGALADPWAYVPDRVNAPGLDPYKPHPNSYVLRKRTYDRAGGYDERYRGIYGTDGAFRKRLEGVSKVLPLIGAPLIRYPREVQGDASTVSLPRKSDANTAAKKARDKEIDRSGQRRPMRGMTPWERVA